MAQSSPLNVLAEFAGSSLQWIHTAEPEFQRKQFDLSNYTILVVDQHESVTVILKSPDKSEGVRGNMGSYPGYEVEIDKKDGKVMRSNYIR
jgi:hypothetical protein